MTSYRRQSRERESQRLEISVEARESPIAARRVQQPRERAVFREAKKASNRARIGGANSAEAKAAARRVQQPRERAVLPQAIGQAP